MTPAAYTLARMSPTCLDGNGSAVGTPSIAATARSPCSMIPTATGGCSRRSRRGCPGASTQRQRPSHRRNTWRAHFAAPPPRTESTRSASAGQMRTGRPEWYAEYMVAEQGERTSDVIECDLIIGGSPGTTRCSARGGDAFLLAKSIERHALSRRVLLNTRTAE